MYIFPTTHIEIYTQNPKQIEFVKGPCVMLAPPSIIN